MNWTVEKVPELRGYTVEWAETGNFYLSRRNVLYHSENLKPPFKKIAAISAPFWKQTASSFRLAQRLLRFQVTNVIPLDGGDVFVTFDKSVGIVRDGKYHDLKNLARPCRVLRAACARDENGEFINTRRAATRSKSFTLFRRIRSGIFTEFISTNLQNRFFV
jgi:hypothetical protein